MDTQTFYEIIGYIGSGLVALSLSMKRILYLRIVNLIGSIIFTIYAILIGAYPVVIVNILIALINLYYLYQIFSAEEYFRLLEVQPDSRYVAEFLKFYHEDIQRFAPDFRHDPSMNRLLYIVLRDMVPSGLFIGYQDGERFVIELDYVTEGYRDFKSGQYIYRDSRDDFAKHGIRQLIATAMTPAHARYLERVGFQKRSATEYVLKL